MSLRAAGVAETLSSKGSLRGEQEMTDADKSDRAGKSGENSEEAELLGAVADQHILGLLVVVEHHLVGLAADARLLVTSERRVCGIGVVAIGPDTACLDRPAEAVKPVGVTA